MSISEGSKRPVIRFLLGSILILIAFDWFLNDHRESFVGKDKLTFFITKCVFWFNGVDRKAPMETEGCSQEYHNCTVRVFSKVRAFHS